MDKEIKADDIRRVVGKAHQNKLFDAQEQLITELFGLGKNEESRKMVYSLGEVVGKMISRAIQLEQGEEDSKKVNASFNQFLDRTGFLEEFNGKLDKQKLIKHIDTKKLENMDIEEFSDRIKGLKIGRLTPKELSERIKSKNVEDLPINLLAKFADHEELKLMQLQEMTNTPIAHMMKLMKKKLHDLGFKFDDVKVDGIDKITRRFVKKLTSNLSENFKNTSKLYSLGAAALITVVACTVLNWTYPRIIEKFFPQLLEKDEPSEAKKGGVE